MSMRPTRRGYVVGGAVAAALLAGTTFGARALDAVVLPGAVALVAAAIQVRRTPEFNVDRLVPAADVAGTAVTLKLTVDGDRTAPVTIRDRLPTGADPVDRQRNGIEPGEAVVDAAVGGTPVTYTAVPQRRGEHTIGPATVVTTDALGLLKRSRTVDHRDTLVAFPRIGTLPNDIGAELRAATRPRASTQRDEFDDLREYVRGDSLRDIHWKSSARHDELMVQEFADRADPDRVAVAVGTDTGASQGGDRGETPTGDTAERAADTPADRMADAAATACVSLVRGGASVTLTTPSGSVDAAPGRIRPALRHLAVASGGRVPVEDADVVVVAEDDAVSIRVDGREYRFEGRVDDVVSIADVDDVADRAGRSETGAEGRTAPATGGSGGRSVVPDGAGDSGGGSAPTSADEVGPGGVE